MAAGLPVIASDLPAFHEFLTPRQDALLVPPGDAAALATAMRRLVADPRLRVRLATAGPCVARRFRWEEVARRHLAIYARLQAARAVRRLSPQGEPL
jgi:glycosyltransferase involved in cell wall biosynthesis